MAGLTAPLQYRRDVLRECHLRVVTCRGLSGERCPDRCQADEQSREDDCARERQPLRHAGLQEPEKNSTGNDTQPDRVPKPKSRAHRPTRPNLRLRVDAILPGWVVVRMEALTFPRVSSAPNAPLAQLDRASGYEPGGRRFESCRARQSFQQFAGSALKGHARVCPILCPPLTSSAGNPGLCGVQGRLTELKTSARLRGNRARPAERRSRCGRTA